MCTKMAAGNIGLGGRCFWGFYYFPLIVCLFLLFYVLQAAHRGVEIAFEYQWRRRWSARFGYSRQVPARQPLPLILSVFLSYNFFSSVYSSPHSPR